VVNSLLNQNASFAFLVASVTSTEVGWNCILDSNVNALCQCPPVADENREAMRTTSMMRDCNASALTPARKSSNGVLSSRHFSAQAHRQFSTMGFLLGITAFLNQHAKFKLRPVLPGLLDDVRCKSLACLRFS